MFRMLVMLATLAGILLVAGFLIGGILGMSVALILAIAINFASYWYSDRIVLRIYRARPIKDKKLDSMLDKLSVEAKIPKPKLYMAPHEVPNAFATGRSHKKAVIVVTRGLLNLDKDEVEGVLAHEMGHIKNKDILTSVIAATIAAAISYIAQIGYFSLFFGGRRDEGSLLWLVLIIIFAPLAAILIKTAISRSREYKADFTGAMFTKKPMALASALRKISSTAKKKPMRGPTATSHLWIVNPFQGDWFTSLFSTHPPIELRIKKLEGMSAR